jgi:hypothetical protein
VLLAGEDVPVDSLVGKVVRSELTKGRRGPLIPEDCPVFPVKQWLQWLAKRSRRGGEPAQHHGAGVF